MKPIKFKDIVTGATLQFESDFSYQREPNPANMTIRFRHGSEISFKVKSQKEYDKLCKAIHDKDNFEISIKRIAK